MANHEAAHLDRAAGATLFGSDIAGYQAARLDYPAALYDAIRARCGGDAGAVLEIGPGTGLATRDILTRLNPVRVTAVEADARLADHLGTAVTDPRLTVVSGGFVEAPVGGRFDLACSAAAFHWLDPEPAFAKLRRLLRPGGTLALWWNTYRQPGEDALADAVVPMLSDLALAPSEGPRGHHSLDVEYHRRAIGDAGFAGFEAFRFRRERILDAEGARALYASYSYIRALPGERRKALLDAISALVDTRFGGRARNVVLSALYLATAPRTAVG